MLSAIKTGKKKKKTTEVDATDGPAAVLGSRTGGVVSLAGTVTATGDDGQAQQQQQQQQQQQRQDRNLNHDGGLVTAQSDMDTERKNQSAADKLRHALKIGGIMSSATSRSAVPPGSASSASKKEPPTTMTSDDDVVVLPPTNYLPASYKQQSTKAKTEHEMTVAELAARERAGFNSGIGMSWDETMTRNVYRTGKKRKMKMKSGNDVDSDEEVERMKRHLPEYQHLDGGGGGGSGSLSTGQLQQPTAKALKRQEHEHQKDEERNRRRLLDQYKKEQLITSKCYWWIQSSNFAQQRMIAFGKHVTLMMAPLNASLVPGHHFYIVPIKHAPSFVDCSDLNDVWEEVRMFRQSLENVYARDRKGIVMVETVLPSKGSSGTSSLWQTRLEAVPVPFSVLQDAPLYFKQSMTEQSEEWGTHNKVLTVMNPHKPLSSVIPKGFPYFACDFGSLSTSRTATGYAQIIESSSFSHDFGLDTLASMMELDPIRFERKKKFPQGMEERLVEEFEKKWKQFDWTTELASTD